MMNDNLYLALLAMDAYNHGYHIGVADADR